MSGERTSSEGDRTAPGLSCGVVMCTFNGARHLTAQLESIVNQRRQPDRLVIRDDGSTDGTLDVLMAFADDAPFAVSVHQNPSRLGVARNFEATLHEIGTDIIFLCDQDDVWLPHKIEQVTGHFASDSRVMLVETNAQLVNDGGRPLPGTLFEALGLSALLRDDINGGHAFRRLLRQNFVTGAATAIRATLISAALPFPNGWLHDEWLAIVAAALDGLALVDDVAIEYRQHGANVVGMSVPTLRDKPRQLRAIMQLPERLHQRGLADRAIQLHDRLQHQHGVPARHVQLARQLARHAEFRATLPENALRRAAAIVRSMMAGEYQMFTNGSRAVVRDLINR